MVAVIYAVLVTIVLAMWVWSVYLQRELTLNSITMTVGDTFSWVLYIIVALGLGTIIASNFLPVQVWKIFIFLLVMLVESGIILWLTATWVYAVASHKIPQGYRLSKKKREDAHLTFTILSTIVVVGTMVVAKDTELPILVFLTVPVLVLIERAVVLNKRIQEINKFETYTEEEVLVSEQRLRVAVETGKVLKPKENVLKMIIKREKARYKMMVNASKAEVASENMEKVKRKNDNLTKTSKTSREEDDAK